MSGGFPVAKEDVGKCFHTCPVCGGKVTKVEVWEMPEYSLYDSIVFRIECENWETCEAMDETGACFLHVHADGHGYVEWY